MGPRAHPILHVYWYRLWMVARAGGNYGGGIPIFWGVTPGAPLSPTILIVVVDAVVSHCIFLVAEGAGGQDGWKR